MYVGALARRGSALSAPYHTLAATPSVGSPNLPDESLAQPLPLPLSEISAKPRLAILGQPITGCADPR
jgi:hypothetical protein